MVAALLLSTGEAPATSFTNDGGTRARTLCLWGSPFSATCRSRPEETALYERTVQEAVRGINAGVLMIILSSFA